jgi:hypothetical protein
MFCKLPVSQQHVSHVQGSASQPDCCALTAAVTPRLPSPAHHVLACAEKEPGMFGTLVVQLPVEGGHTGGWLEVTGPTGDKHVWKTEKVRHRKQVEPLQQTKHRRPLGKSDEG